MWHNYSRGKNVIMTSSILAFSDDATTQKHVFKVAFFCICSMLLTKTSYKLLKISFLSSIDGIICYLKSLNVFKKTSKKKLKCNFYFEASEYSLMLKLTNFVIWSNFSSFHYAGTKN